jgi:hypothetical protein
MRRNAMKNLKAQFTGGVLAAAGLAVALALLVGQTPARAQSGEAAEPVSFRIEPAIADLRGKGRGKGLWLMGAGLQPGQEVAVYVTMLGAESDITFMLTRVPKANSEGTFVTSWELRPKRFARVFGDRMTFQLRDPDSLKVLATAPLAVCKPSKDKSKAAPWCEASQALLPIEKKKKKKRKKKK